MDIEEIALKELQEEETRKLIEAHKQKLRRPWWIKLFPWRIRITFKIIRK